MISGISGFSFFAIEDILKPGKHWKISLREEENFLEILKIFLSRSGPKFKNQEQFDKQTYGMAFFKYILGTKYISGPFREIKVFKGKWLPRGLKADLLAPRMKEMEKARRV